jgi:hypothetical protein
MAERYPGWVNGMDAQDARLATGTLVAPAVSSGTVQVQSQPGIRPGPGNPGRVEPATGLTVRVVPFQGVIQDGASATGGAYLVTLDAAKTVSLSSASTANFRVDLVVAEVVTPTAENPAGFVIRAIRGTDGSETPPATPATAISLATVRVNQSATQIAAGDITDTRPWTCAAGGILRIWNANTRPSSPYPGLYVYNHADRVLEMWDGTSWRRYLPEDDTGWQTVTLTSNWTPYQSSHVQLRRIGRVAYLRGNASPRVAIPSPGDSVICTLPSAFRPTQIRTWAALSQGTVLVNLTMSTNGDVFTHDAAIGANRWVSVDSSWALG